MNRYIKLWEDFNSEVLYQKISSQEFGTGTSYGTKASQIKKVDREILTFFLKSIKNIEFDFNHNSNGLLNIEISPQPENEYFYDIVVWPDNDEYFYCEITLSSYDSDSEFYKCDSIDGLIQFLKNQLKGFGYKIENKMNEGLGYKIENKMNEELDSETHNSLYQEISEEDWNEKTHYGDPAFISKVSIIDNEKLISFLNQKISKKEIKNFTDILRSKQRTHSHAYTIYFINITSLVSVEIYPMDDEYFYCNLVSVEIEGEDLYYKCDQMDGLIQFLKDMINKFGYFSDIKDKLMKESYDNSEYYEEIFRSEINNHINKETRFCSFNEHDEKILEKFLDSILFYDDELDTRIECFITGYIFTNDISPRGDVILNGLLTLVLKDEDYHTECFKTEDEWFYLKENYKWYKCDQLNGLIELIKKLYVKC